MKLLVHLVCVSLISFWIVPVNAECGGNLTATNQASFLQSPGYPVAYPQNLTCIWYIQADRQNETIVVEVLDSDLQDDPECGYDSVKVYCDHSNKRTLQNYLGSFCGSFAPTFQSPKDKLRLVFKTRGLFVKRGFRLKFKSVAESTCNLTLPVGYYKMAVVSPGYPDHYYNDLDCFWTFEDTKGFNFSVQMWPSHIEGQWPDCSNDSLAFYSGPGPNKTRDAYFCNPRRPLLRIEASDYLQAVFTTNDAVTRSGFTLWYSSNLRTCDRTLEASNQPQTLYCPLYGQASETPALTNCRLSIFTYSTNIKMVVENLPSPFVGNYSISVYDGPDTSLSSYLGSFQSPHELTFFSGGRFLTIDYQTADPQSGFDITYSNGTLSGCGDSTVSNVTVWNLYSPNYPLSYPQNADCSWRIDGGSSSTVNLTVISSNMSHSDRCVKDYVEAFDGFDDTSPSLGKWCGTSAPTKYSTDRYMFLKFHSSSNSHGKFHINIKYELTPGIDVKTTMIVFGCVVGVVLIFLFVWFWVTGMPRNCVEKRKNHQEESVTVWD